MSKLEISVGKLSLRKLIEVHIPFKYSLHGEECESDLKILIDSEHNDFIVINEKLTSVEESEDFDANDLLELSDISDRLEKFIESIVKAKYIEDHV